MRYLLICLLTALAFLFGHFLTSPPQPTADLKIRGVAWCYMASYPSMKAYDQVKAEPQSLIDVHSKGVTVWVRCKQH